MESPPTNNIETAKHPSALGKYAYVGGGSDEFAREKQEEIEREDRPLTPNSGGTREEPEKNLTPTLSLSKEREPD